MDTVITIIILIAFTGLIVIIDHSRMRHIGVCPHCHASIKYLGFHKRNDTLYCCVCGRHARAIKWSEAVIK